MPIGKGWKHRKLGSSRSCAAGSFRRVRSGSALITVCCPKGKWTGKKCKVGMKGVGLDKRRAFGGSGDGGAALWMRDGENRGTFVRPDGVRVTMYRRRQKVRFYTATGRRIGPEQANVAPAIAYTMAHGWVAD